MRFTISKQFTFSASHTLDLMPEGHQCRRLHGHNYVVTVELAIDALDARGMVVDYGDLGWLRQWLDDELDHRHLNEIVPFHPTAENLAAWLLRLVADRHPQATAVVVSETPTSTARAER